MTYQHLSELATRFGLVLGSASPRRKQLLEELSLHFRQLSAELGEERIQGESATTYARRVALEKALFVLKKCGQHEVVLGCDTVVWLGDEIFGKPNSENEAIETLMRLSGKAHTVTTAVAIVSHVSDSFVGHDDTIVHFHPLVKSRVEEYVRTGESLDKAGAYGIQGMGAFLVDRIEGNLDTVIGLPRETVNRLAGEFLLSQQGTSRTK